MQGKLRHVGVMCKNLQESMRFYQQFGFQKMSQKVAMEEWAGKKLKILKLANPSGTIELIEGDWKPHVALTLIEGTMDDLWERFATKAEVILEFKKVGDLEIFYLRDPAGNYVEVVREH